MLSRKVFAGFVAGALLLGACGEQKETATEKAADLVADEEAQETTTTAASKVMAPLSGLPVDDDAARRPALSIKVDNSPSGRPQAGLEKADLIVEEKVEGGVTRFIAIFQSQESELVGPIRSLRTTDRPVVSAFRGVFAFSDGVAFTLNRLKGAPVVTVTEHDDASAFVNPKGRKRPFATFAATARLRKEAGSAAQPPAAAFPFLADGEAFAPAGATPAASARIDYGGRTSGSFDWDAATGTWQRSSNGRPHLLVDGTRLAFTNVVIQKVGYRRVGYNDSSRFPVEEAVVVGEGEAIVLSAGKQVKAKWSKPSNEAMTTFTDAAGAPIKLLAGPTMIALAPRSEPVSVT
ncbi:MAG TPA: DUF3048 domain-containing protein [Acidimicrobiales bacterium]|nr:DUF3048 domain-containing protein [Acidimicrobiales bacterium]